MSALPFLPGNTFNDITKTKFHVSQTLGYRNGYAIPGRPRLGVGGEPLPFNQLTEEELDELANTKPSLTYGAASKPAPVEFVPAFVAFDKKVLKFDAYFKQTVHESPQEFYRIRCVSIYYYLEDDSIAVIEPLVENSGIPQGKLIKRQRLPKNDLGDCWHWSELNLATEVTFYGKVFRIVNCDQWTAEYLRSEGIELNQPEHVPSDPYAQAHAPIDHTFTTPSTFDKLKQFLQLDRHVLRFFCIWDDRDSMFGEVRRYILHYFLVDDTVEIREVHEPNDGRDPFPVLLRRQRLQKLHNDVPSDFPSITLEVSDKEVKAWYTPMDFALGKTLNIMGRKFLIYDMDKYTEEFYSVNFGVSEFASVDVTQPSPKPVKAALPPYNGYGSLEDSLQSCLTLVPQPPKKDFIKMMENDGKILRFLAILDRPQPEDENRKFIISFYLSDDTISIYEPPQRNAGVIGGKFLERRRVAKPESSDTDNPDYYRPGDFAIGAKVEVFKHVFVIQNADLYVLKYMENRPEGEVPSATIRSLRDIHHSPSTDDKKKPSSH